MYFGIILTYVLNFDVKKGPRGRKLIGYLSYNFLLICSGIQYASHKQLFVHTLVGSSEGFPKPHNPNNS